MSVKRQSTDVIDFKRGSDQINFIYRGTTLVWARSSGGIGADYFQTMLSFNSVNNNNSYSTNLSIKNNEI